MEKVEEKIDIWKLQKKIGFLMEEIMRFSREVNVLMCAGDFGTISMEGLEKLKQSQDELREAFKRVGNACGFIGCAIMIDEIRGSLLEEREEKKRSAVGVKT